MKKIAFLLLILLTSCGSVKKVNHTNFPPKNFDEAEKWFDEMHKKNLN